LLLLDLLELAKLKLLAAVIPPHHLVLGIHARVIHQARRKTTTTLGLLLELLRLLSVLLEEGHVMILLRRTW
jgi:hypothetical protein